MGWPLDVDGGDDGRPPELLGGGLPGLLDCAPDVVGCPVLLDGGQLISGEMQTCCACATRLSGEGTTVPAASRATAPPPAQASTAAAASRRRRQGRRPKPRRKGMGCGGDYHAPMPSVRP